MVLRGKPVGEQGAADRWTALDPFSRARARGRRGGIPPRRPLSLSVCFLEGPAGPFFMPQLIFNAGPVDLLGLRNP